MGAFYSDYEGEDIDEAVEWVKSYKNTSPSKIIESTFENKVDLNTLLEEGKFTIAYYIHSKDDDSTKTIELEVIKVNRNLTIQRYDLNGLTAQRSYYHESSRWSTWNFVKSFIVADENEEINVGSDTLVFRVVKSRLEEFYSGENVGTPYNGSNNIFVMPSDDDEFWGVCATKMGSYFVPLDQYLGGNTALLTAISELNEEKVDRADVPDWVFDTPEVPQGNSATKESIGLSDVDNTSDLNKPVSTAQQAAITKALNDAKTYSDTQLNNLIDGAPETLNTIGQVADAINSNSDIMDALTEAIGNKAGKTAFDEHDLDTEKHINASDREKIDSISDKAEKADLNGVKFYSSVTQLLPEKETMNDVTDLTEIINVMPNNSVFLSNTDQIDFDNGIVPTMAGSLEIKKIYNDNRVILVFYPSLNNDNVFIGISMAFYHPSSGLTGWKKVLNEVNARNVIFNTQKTTDKASFILSDDGRTASIQLYDGNKSYRLQLGYDDGEPQLKMLTKEKNVNEWTETKLNYLMNCVTPAMYNGMYPGTDLTIRFAKEISLYSSVWEWIKARIDNGNYNGIYVNDFIPLSIGDENHIMRILGINSYTGIKFTDKTDPIGNHIDFISERCIGPVVWGHEGSSNNGESAAKPNPYLSSGIPQFFDSIYELLPDSLKSVIINKGCLMENKYSSESVINKSTNFAYTDIGKIWVPSEYEVFGSVVFGSPYAGANGIQYPLFRDYTNSRYKYKINDESEYVSWALTTTLENSSDSVLLANGILTFGNIIFSRHVPICFRIG